MDFDAIFANFYSKPVPGFPGYLVTENGYVLSTRSRKRVLKPAVDKSGYNRVRIENGSIKKSFYIHRLVAAAFVPNDLGKPFVNHIDHDKSNNAVENLEWCTHAENIQHDWKNGKRSGLRGENNGSQKWGVRRVRAIRKMWADGRHSQSAISRHFNMPISTVHAIISGRIWSETL